LDCKNLACYKKERTLIGGFVLFGEIDHPPEVTRFALPTLIVPQIDSPGNTGSLPESFLQEMADTIKSSLSEYGANVEAEITG
jgi:hypothetical protein